VVFWLIVVTRLCVGVLLLERRARAFLGCDLVVVVVVIVVCRSGTTTTRG